MVCKDCKFYSCRTYICNIIANLSLYERGWAVKDGHVEYIKRGDQVSLPDDECKIYVKRTRL